MKKERINEIWGVFFLLLGLFTLASLFFYHPEDLPFYASHPTSPVANYAGISGAYLAFALFSLFGMSAFILPFIFLLWAECFFHQNVPERKVFKFIGLLIALVSSAALVAISVNLEQRFVNGGALGYITGNYLLRYVGSLGSYILVGGVLLLSLLLATDFLIYPLFRSTAEKLAAVFGILRDTFSKKSKINETGLTKREQARQLKELRKKEKELEKIRKAEEKRQEKLRLETERQKEKELTKQTGKIPNIPIKITTYQPIGALQDDASKPAKNTKDSDKNNELKNPANASEIVKQPAAPKEKDPIAAAAESEPSFEGVIGSAAPEKNSYEFPPIDLLKRPKADAIGSSDDLAANSQAIETTLAEFGIEVKVVEVEQGPKITLYELLPAPGVRADSIATYENDISMALKATSLRLIIPIPGKQTIGIEVPNVVSRPILVREMIETEEFRAQNCALPLILGKNSSGRPMIADLASMPHILIAGTTGSGKTVCINSIITGFLYHCTPAQLKLVMIDPKMVELAVYNKIPHMLSPVVTDVRKAANTLNWVMMEMDKRYRLLSTVGVRNIQTFNSRPMSESAIEEVSKAAEDSENVIPAQLPYIVVIIDELADLMLMAGDKVEPVIQRLAQLARAVGIHLILATQRPSVDVITGVIKSNFPSRVAFKVASVVDSRTILDNKGAEKLLGRGDMLFIKPGSDVMVRGQAPLIADDEINGVVGFVSRQGKPEYHSGIQAVQNGAAQTNGGSGERDEIFEEAKKVVLTTRRASTSYLQRKLGIGYSRAARLMDQLEADGVIGSQDGVKPREILLPNPAGDYTEATPADNEAEDENF